MNPLVPLTVHALGVALAALAALALIGSALRSRFVVAQPDEWLLQVRSGRLVKAGVGATAWRWPGDLVVRFSSTLQRVGFEAQAITREKVAVVVEGFVFWAVSAEGEGPFRAFQHLGLANLCDPPKDLKHPKHLFTGPQHKAFQQLVVGTIQRHLATVALDQVLLDQDTVIEGIRARLLDETHDMAVRIDQVQIVRARPADPALLASLSAKEQERIREDATRVKLETNDRMRAREVELQTAQSERESRARLEVERAEARLLEERLRLQREAAERRQAEALLEAARKEAIALREEETRKAVALASEANRLAVLEARRRRRELARTFELDTIRERANAERDAARARAQAEEEKSDALRADELRRHVADKVAESLKVTDGKWVTVGPETPAASLAHVVTALGETLGRTA